MTILTKDSTSSRLDYGEQVNWTIISRVVASAIFCRPSRRTVRSRKTLFGGRAVRWRLQKFRSCIQRGPKRS
jgi:hypothetical protein